MPKEVRKVWTCTYVGRHPQAPAMIQVPSYYTSGKPEPGEIVEALVNMGYSQSQAMAIRGADQDWKYR